MNKLKTMIMAGAALFGAVQAWGATVEVTTWEALKTALANGNDVKVMANLQHDGTQAGALNKTATVDLCGRTIYAQKSDSRYRLFYASTGNLTIIDSVGGGIIDGQSSSCVVYGSFADVEGKNATLTIDGDITIKNFFNTNDSGGQNDRGAISIASSCTFNFKPKFQEALMPLIAS